MSLPPLPWKPCRTHEDVNGPYWEIDPEDVASYEARPFTKIFAADGQTVFTAHDLFEFRPGVAEEICRRVQLCDELAKALLPFVAWYQRPEGNILAYIRPEEWKAAVDALAKVQP